LIKICNWFVKKVKKKWIFEPGRKAARYNFCKGLNLSWKKATMGQIKILGPAGIIWDQGSTWQP